MFLLFLYPHTYDNDPDIEELLGKARDLDASLGCRKIANIWEIMQACLEAMGQTA